MDEIWAKLYAAAKAVQQERQISDYVLAGGVAAAGRSTRCFAFCRTVPAAHPAGRVGNLWCS